MEHNCIKSKFVLGIWNWCNKIQFYLFKISKILQNNIIFFWFFFFKKNLSIVAESVHWFQFSSWWLWFIVILYGKWFVTTISVWYFGAQLRTNPSSKMDSKNSVFSIFSCIDFSLEIILKNLSLFIACCHCCECTARHTAYCHYVHQRRRSKKIHFKMPFFFCFFIRSNDRGCIRLIATRGRKVSVKWPHNCSCRATTTPTKTCSSGTVALTSCAFGTLCAPKRKSCRPCFSRWMSLALPVCSLFFFFFFFNELFFFFCLCVCLGTALYYKFDVNTRDEDQFKVTDFSRAGNK